MIINNRGHGMTIYVKKEKYDKVCEICKKIYPKAKVKILSKERKISQLTEKELEMLGLIKEKL